MEGLLIAVAAIHPGHVERAWRDTGPMLARAVARTPDKPNVRQRLLDGTAQLWAAIDGDRPVAALVTEITGCEERWCRVWLVAGAQVDAWCRCFLDLVVPWARACGCVGLWASGREGWDRLARRLGWTRDGTDAGFPRWTWRI